MTFNPNRDQLIEEAKELKADGLTVKEIAARLGVCQTTVRQRLRSYPVLSPVELRQQNVARARELHADGVSKIEIAFQLGVALKTVTDYLSPQGDVPRWRARDNQVRELRASHPGKTWQELRQICRQLAS